VIGAAFFLFLGVLFAFLAWRMEDER